MKKILIFVCCCLLSVLTFNTSAEEAKQLPAPRTGTPVIDGKLDDKVWQNNRFYSDF